MKLNAPRAHVQTAVSSSSFAPASPAARRELNTVVPAPARPSVAARDGFEAKRGDVRSAGRRLGEVTAEAGPVVSGKTQSLAAFLASEHKIAKKEAAAAAKSSAPVEASAQVVELTGEQQALKEVAVQTVAEQRLQVEQSQQHLHAETLKEVDQLFAYAQPGAAPSPPTKVFPSPDGKSITVEEYDSTGKLQERTIATRLDDGSVQLDTVRIVGERQERDVVRTKDDGSSTVQHADWKPAPGADLANAPSLDALKESQDLDVAVTENKVWRQGADVVTSEYIQAGGGVQQSETLYTTQPDAENVSEHLRGSFQANQPVDVARTRKYIVPPGSGDGDESPAPTFSETVAYSQAGVQATSVSGVVLDTDDLDVEDELEHGPHTASDLNTVIASFRDEEGEEDSVEDVQRQWTLEKSDGKHYSSQTFQEGNEEASFVLHREANGPVVTESYSGKAYPPDGDDDMVDVKGESTRTFGKDGMLQSVVSSTLEADGSTSANHYQCTTEETAEGLVVTETLQRSTTNAEGQKYTTDQKTQSLVSNEGMQLKSTSVTTTAPDGTQVQSVVDQEGEKLLLTQNDQVTQVTDVSQLPTDKNTQELLLQSSIATAQTVQDYATKGGAKALGLIATLGQVDMQLDDEVTLAQKVFSTGYKLFGNESVQRALQGTIGVVGAAGGVAGAVAGGLQIVKAIRDQNVPNIIQGLVNLGISISNGYSSASAIYNAIKGIPEVVKIPSGALRIPGWFQKVPGLGALSKTTGALRVLKAVKAVGGIANVLGVALGAVDVINGIRKGNGAQIAKGGLGIASTIGGAVASGAVAGSIGGPIGMIAGAAVGVGFSLLAWAGGKLIDWAFGPDRDMAPVMI